MNKNTQYNNGYPIDFKTIKKNRKQAVKEIAEGNDGLELLLNTCLDLNIETEASCGDESPYITFVFNNHSKNHLISVIDAINKLPPYGKNQFDIALSQKNNNEFKISFYIQQKGKESSKFFIFINHVIRSFKKRNFDPDIKTLLLINLTQTLNDYFPYALTVISNTTTISKEYQYVIYVNGINEYNRYIIKDILEYLNLPFNSEKTTYRIHFKDFQQIYNVYNYLYNEKHSNKKM